MLDFTPSARQSYQNIRRAKPASSLRSTPANKLEKLDVNRENAFEHTEPIEHLIVSGQGYEAVKQLKKLENRIDENTTVCLLHDGLGVLQHVRDEIFNPQRRAGSGMPNFYLGHLTNKLAFSRTTQSVKELKTGSLILCQPDLPPQDHQVMTVYGKDAHLAANAITTKIDFAATMTAVPDLKTKVGPYGDWLAAKLPGVIFDSVVESTCVLFDMTYAQLAQSRPAQGTMSTMLTEILGVIYKMPEVRHSDVARRLTNPDYATRMLRGMLLSKYHQRPKLATRINKALPIDTSYYNNFFITRAKQLGLRMPKNMMAMEIIRTKHAEAKRARQTDIGFDPLTLPSWSRHDQHAEPWKRPSPADFAVTFSRDSEGSESKTKS